MYTTISNLLIVLYVLPISLLCTTVKLLKIKIYILYLYLISQVKPPAPARPYLPPPPQQEEGEGEDQTGMFSDMLAEFKQNLGEDHHHLQETLQEGLAIKNPPKKPPNKTTKNVFFWVFLNFLFFMKIIQTFLFETDFL